MPNSGTIAIAELDLDAVFHFPTDEDASSSHCLSPPAWLHKPNELVAKIHLRTIAEKQPYHLRLDRDEDKKTLAELVKVKMRFDDAYRNLFHRFVSL